MAVSFVIGRAGTGKTHRCLTSIIDAVRLDPLHPPILWLLPRQATFAAERELACNTATGGYFRVRVLSFEQLGQEILAECGGANVPEITPLGRQMLLGHLLRRHAADLKFFQGVASQPGLASQLDTTFAEFERAGKDPSDFDQLLAASPNDDSDALLDKIHDLRLIYREYKTHLGQERFDQHRRLMQVLACIKTSTQFKTATVYCDGFRDFTDYERQMLAALGKACKTVEILLLADPKSPLLRDRHLLPDEHSLFHPVEIAYRRLRNTFHHEGVPIDDPPVTLKDVHRFETPAMQNVERHALGSTITHVSRDSTGIELLDAPDRAAEVDAAARRIIDLVAAGHRYRDIAVLTRDLSSYADLIDRSFREHNLPFFTDRRRSMSHHPLLRFIRSMLAIARANWPHEPLMDLLKTDFTGLTFEQVSELENYVLRHRIRADAWAATDSWTYGDAGPLTSDDPTTPAISLSQPIDQHRRQFVNRIAPFTNLLRTGASIRDAVAALFHAFDQFSIRQTLGSWITEAESTGRLEEMAEHQQVWAEIVKLFDEMVGLLGDEHVDANSFTDILEAGLEQFDLALTPPTVDELLVGQIDRTRAPEIKAVLVLGVNDGCFPRVPREGSVLSDADRHFLSQHQLGVLPATARRLLDEDLLAYYAFTRPSQLLYVSYSRSDSGGRSLAPSKYFERLAKMFPKAVRTTVPREPSRDPRWIGTPRKLIAALTQWVRIGLEEADSANAWPALYQWLATQPADPRFSAWRSLAYSNDAALSPDVASHLFQSPLHTTAVELESFAACPFQHFLDYGLGLKTRDDEQDVSAGDLGNVYHQVLERVVGHLLKRRQSWTDLTDKERDRLIHSAAEQIGQKLRGEILLSNARNRYLLHRIERTLGQVVQTHKTGASRGRLKPAHARLRFGEGGDLPELTIPTPKGASVHLSGKIDRVDFNQDGDEAAVIDYRLGNHTLQLDQVYHGLALQLLTYLLVLEAHGQALTGRKLTPAAAFYVQMMRRLGDVAHPSEALSLDDPALHLQAKPRGLLAEGVVRAIDIDFKDGPSEVIHCRIKKDGGFGAKSQSDLASADEFSALMNHVKTRIGVIADEILAGKIDIRPYLHGNSSPCPHCHYRAVCRFESAEGYRILPTIGREDVLLRVLQDRKENAHGK